LNPSIEKYVAAGLDIVFPPACAFCGRLCRPDRSFPGICRTCLPVLPLRQKPESRLQWFDLARKYGLSGGQVPGDAAIYCAAWYRDGMRQALLRLKFADSPDLAAALAALLIQLMHQYGLSCSAVMAVPLHWQRLRERGYNQSSLLARIIARHFAVPDRSAELARIRITERQSAVGSRSGRAANLAGAFALTGRTADGFSPESQSHTPLKGKTQEPPILLVDDILTTGATLTAAAAPLWAAGLPVAGLVVASEHR
jgi:predicted amidophosphoribosyltransferase